MKMSFWQKANYWICDNFVFVWGIEIVETHNLENQNQDPFKNAKIAENWESIERITGKKVNSIF